MTHHHKRNKRSALGGFFTCWRGLDVLWIEENYNLYHHDDDTEKQRYFVDRDRSEFMNDTDTFKMKIDKSYYVVRFMFDAEDELKQRIIKHFHNNRTKVVSFD